LSKLLERLQAQTHEHATIADLARQVGMSRRTFLRRFKAGTGLTPGAWLASVRLARARQLLVSSKLPLEEVAATCGLGSLANLRHHFRRQVKVSPSVYRARFGAGP
jgi:AraC family transcriptional activator FtrA